MKYFPSDPDLRKHIDYYWIVLDSDSLFQDIAAIHDFPGITPELILVLDGHYTIHYQGKTHKLSKSKMYSFIHHPVMMNVADLKSFVIINFKSRALSSLLPFTTISSTELMAAPIREVDELFGKQALRLTQHLKQLHDPQKIVEELDHWIKPYYQRGRAGFLTELANDLPAKCSPRNLMQLTGYSSSTLERHFKRDTGLTPKKYHSLQRFRLAVNDIYKSQSTDWSYYVHEYGYYDQSHFIKEIKRYSGFTPSQLLNTPGMVSLRPK